MSFSVSYGDNLSLSRACPGLRMVSVGVGWKTVFELDASVFMLNENRKVRSDEDLIFYNNTESSDGSVKCLWSGTGVITEDRVTFTLDLGRIPIDVSGLVFAVSIHEAESQGLHFGMVPFLHIRIVDENTDNEVIRYELEGNRGGGTAMILAEIYRYRDEWKFKAIGEEHAGGLAALAEHFGVNVDSGDDAGVDLPGIIKKRKSPKEVIAKQTADIKEAIKAFLPQIQAAKDRNENESSTRLLLDRILQDILGYKIEDIKTEQKIQGRKADYVLSADGKEVLVIETKRIGSALREKQIFQTTSYGAYAGIRWALLTNLTTWQLYRISTGDKVEAHLVFSVNLGSVIDEETAHYLYLISRTGISRKGLLDKLWVRIKALNYETLATAILMDDVITKIRSVITRDTGCQLTNEEVRASIEKNILQLE